MNETRYDPAARPDDWDEEAYEQAERAWQSWCEREAEETDAEDEQLSEEEKLMRAENRRLIAERHDEEKQRRLEAMANGEEICEDYYCNDEDCDGEYYDDEEGTAEEPYHEEKTRQEEPTRAPWTAWEIYKYVVILFVIFMVLFTLFLSMGDIVVGLLE